MDSEIHSSGCQKKLTYAQVAEIYHVTPRTVETWAAKGIIPCIRAGRTIRFDLKEVEAHLKSRPRPGRKMA